jgi:ATP-dependent helicase Lhr and Lhr-like helicase
MESSQALGSEGWFERLHPQVQRWIYQHGWTELREVQTRTIEAILDSQADIVLAASTASGKTEAAFFPILTQIADDHSDGIRVLYVGPLRALINDQFFRLEQLCEALRITVTKWHGDVSDTLKRRARDNPEGILLITPESLEAIFVLRPEYLRRMFGKLAFVVIDELHAFLSSDRGVHLYSLLRRLTVHVGHRPRYIGLSATIGDLSVAAKWLCPAEPTSVHVISIENSDAELKLQIRGVTAPLPTQGRETEPHDVALRQVADHLVKVMRTTGNHLVFMRRRRDVEALADMLRTICETSGVPNEFFPHHGSLSRELRETLETRLKGGELPTTAVSTVTLELGIDIGSVESVAQIGAPRSVAGLRQRLGRSGRRAGKPAVLRMYAVEYELDAKSSLIDRLRIETVQSVAAVELIRDHWVEPPSPLTQHLSTLLHQILATIVEYGGVTAGRLFDILGGPGAFGSVDIATFERLLRDMAASDPPLLEQAPDGTLMLGRLAELLTDRYDFFAVFKTPEEFKIVTGGRALGTVSLQNAFGPGDYIIFSGLRWRVLDVDDRARIVQVESAPAGRVPRFDGGEPGPIHDGLVAKMKAVFCDAALPTYLDSPAQVHLAEAREVFRLHGLVTRPVTVDDDHILLFPWRGTPTLDALRFALRREELSVTPLTVSLAVPLKDQSQLASALEKIRDGGPIDGAELAELDDNLVRAKYDQYISRDLLRQAEALDRLNTEALPDLCADLLSGLVSL